jgi:hypothetical protein
VQYPLTNYLNADEAIAAIETDFAFACPARLVDQALSRYVPVFAYEFNDEDAPEIFLPPVSYPYGAAPRFLAREFTFTPAHRCIFWTTRRPTSGRRYHPHRSY